MEHRDDKAAVKGLMLAMLHLVRRQTADFALGAGAGNFSALGAADVEETKKSNQGAMADKSFF